MPYREKGIKTNPPVCTTFSLETTQWMIFDSYLQTWEEIQRQEAEEAMKNKKDKKPVQIQQQHVEDPLYSTSMKRALKIMERMIVQNADDEKFEDYKYYPPYETDDNDRENGDYGSVLPLWRFLPRSPGRSTLPRCNGTLSTRIYSQLVTVLTIS